MEHVFPDPVEEVKITKEDVAHAEAEESKAISSSKEKDPNVLRELMLEREDAMSRGGSGRSSVRRTKNLEGTAMGGSPVPAEHK